jgi:cytochrome c-type biogenesis protein CcmH
MRLRPPPAHSSPSSGGGGRSRGPARILAAFAIALTLGLSAAHAVQPDEVLTDPALEARARALSAELRCMVCQNQSIDDSDAPLARDLRVLLRERIAAGDSDGAVMDFLVARYGDFILLRPPVAWNTALLWLAPPAVLVIGGLVALALFRKRKAEPPAPLSDAEKARLAELVEK